MRNLIQGIEEGIGVAGLCVILIAPIVSNAATIIFTPLTLIAVGIIKIVYIQKIDDAIDQYEGLPTTFKVPEQIKDCIDYNFDSGAELSKMKELLNNEIYSEMKTLRRFFMAYFITFLSTVSFFFLAGVTFCIGSTSHGHKCRSEFSDFIKYYLVFN